MFIKYEKEQTEKDENNNDIKKFTDADELTADTVHVCFHDENPPRPCIRKKVKI